MIAWTPTCIRYEADQRHGEILIREFGLEGAKGVDTPYSIDHRLINDDEDNTEPLDSSLVTRCLAAAARCNCLGLDRPDIQYAAKEVGEWLNPRTVTYLD